MTRKDPDVGALPPPGWRVMTKRELHQLKKGEMIEVATNKGVETRKFTGFSETGLLKTDQIIKENLSGLRYLVTSLVGPHRAVLFSPAIEEMPSLLGYDS
jgi:TusA-related sulfurtransferase